MWPKQTKFLLCVLKCVNVMQYYRESIFKFVSKDFFFCIKPYFVTFMKHQKTVIMAIILID